MTRPNRTKAAFVLMCAVLAPMRVVAQVASSPGVSSDVDQKSPLSVDEIVGRLDKKSRERGEALRRFHGTRIYHLQYRGVLGNRDAEMVVNFNYAAPGDNQFVIVSQVGSRFIQEHVFKKLLQAEKEATGEENRQHTALNTNNFNFALAEIDTSQQTPHYVLNVVPKIDNKFLYRGKIWVDAKDFAVTRLEAEPSKSPSFWVTKSEINVTFQSVEGFWLPSENKTKSWLRLGGRALLSIEYKDYKITETAEPEHFGGK
jgi:hypothetical protein